jgi:hypothetical protein
MLCDHIKEDVMGGECATCVEDEKYDSTVYWCGRDTRWCSWLRDCATSRKVVVSIPDCVIGIFH